MHWLPGVLGADLQLFVAQTAHAAACDARKSTICEGEQGAASRAVALLAARYSAGRLATSCLTIPGRGACSQTAIPRRANAAALHSKQGRRWATIRISRPTAAPMRRMSLLGVPGPE